MSNQVAVLPKPTKLDYSLTGTSAAEAITRGLAEAEWYQCPIDRDRLRALLTRRDGPAIRDTLIWFALLGITGHLTYRTWGTGWVVLPYLAYSVLYASTSDSRWHEAGHGTAFRTDWMNNALYELSSFMVMRESVVWRWSHTRHHSDTIIVGRDPEIAVPRPPDVAGIVRSFFNLGNYPKYFRHIVMHAFGSMTADEKTYIPETEFPKIFRNARIYVAIYTAVIALAIASHSFMPLFFVGLTNLFGTWLLVVYGLTQHAGLAENVLDHRLNCRTVYLNPVHRYLYWNMNYHVEHHMFPLVPYHRLPELHAAVKDDCPEPYPSLFAAWREIVPSVLRQVKDPSFHVKRRLPPPRQNALTHSVASPITADAEGWIAVCPASQLGRDDVTRFDCGKKSYAVYRDDEGSLYASDGFCTHGNIHLATGLVKNKQIECSKHNGRFNLVDGSPARAPICRGLTTYPAHERDGHVLINIAQPSGEGARSAATHRFRVVSNRSVATFIKELTLAPLDGETLPPYLPGDYFQFDIPAYDLIAFRSFDIPEPFATVWRHQHVFDLEARNPQGSSRRNNYSLASNATGENVLRFNIRIATPPPGQDCQPGIGSAYFFSLRPGDIVSAIGPFGDFHIRPTQREMLYLGGGAGMAPLRAHLSHLLETESSLRRISFWYGARSRQEIFYDDYFASLAQQHPNFDFHIALSSPLPEDNWSGSTGFIHEVVLEEYLRTHPNPASIEFYLCGPPMMIKACCRMLAELGVPQQQISYDEF